MSDSRREPPEVRREQEDDSGRKGFASFIGMEVSFFATAALIFVIGVIVILFFAL